MTDQQSRRLIGPEITADLYARLKRIEDILLCQRCKGTGDIDHKWMGVIPCPACDGSGSRIDALKDYNQ